MERYTVIGISAGFGPGTILHLSGDQARRRLHALRAATEEDLEKYEVAAPKHDGLLAVCTQGVTFKRGETVGVVFEPGGINKARLQLIAPHDAPEAVKVRREVGKKTAKGRKKSAESAAASKNEAAMRQRIKQSGKGKRNTRRAPAKPARTADTETADQAEQD